MSIVKGNSPGPGRSEPPSRQNCADKRYHMSQGEGVTSKAQVNVSM